MHLLLPSYSPPSAAQRDAKNIAKTDQHIDSFVESRAPVSL